MHAPCLQGEGPSIFKPSDGSYYMMASHLTYWKPNPPMLYHAAAASLASAKWNMLATPAAGPTANTTHNSQSASVFSLQLQDGSSMFVYMGDRWNFYGPGSVSLGPLNVFGYVIHPYLARVTRTCKRQDACTEAQCLGQVWCEMKSHVSLISKGCMVQDATRHGAAHHPVHAQAWAAYNSHMTGAPNALRKHRA